MNDTDLYKFYLRAFAKMRAGAFDVTELTRTTGTEKPPGARECAAWALAIAHGRSEMWPATYDALRASLDDMMKGLP